MAVQGSGTPCFIRERVSHKSDTAHWSRRQWSRRDGLRLVLSLRAEIVAAPFKRRLSYHAVKGKTSEDSKPALRETAGLSPGVAVAVVGATSRPRRRRPRRVCPTGFAVLALDMARFDDAAIERRRLQ